MLTTLELTVLPLVIMNLVWYVFWCYQFVLILCCGNTISKWRVISSFV